MRLDGVLVVDKPVGPTSHDVVATARRALQVRRIGHTGTLDPQASGVLPLVIGQATRMAQYLTAADKEYEATVRFGIETDSYDSSGLVERETGAAPSRDELLSALDRFRGAIDQVPPRFSAKKVAGDRAYDLARRAEPVALLPVRVTVHALDLLAYEPPRARLRIVCSSGFYVRSLAHDLGVAVETGAVLASLVRRRSGDFSLEDAVAFDVLARGTPQLLGSRILPMEGVLRTWPAVQLTAEGRRRIAHGQDVCPADCLAPLGLPTAAHVRIVSHDGRLLALAEPSKVAGLLHPVVVFQYN